VLVTMVVLLVFPVAMIYAAASDLLTMRIPNWVSLLLLAGFAIAAPLTGLTLEAIAWHVAAGALVLTVCFGFFAAGWIGGGDAKLASATALWLGWSALMNYVLIASVLGGVLALVILLVRKVPLPAFLLRQGWILRLSHAKTGVPYGIALAAAGLLVYPDTPWMLAIPAS
jgi:prepilin peptidase CpaA